MRREQPPVHEDSATWYEIWEAVVAIDGMCARFGKGGSFFNLGTHFPNRSLYYLDILVLEGCLFLIWTPFSSYRSIATPVRESGSRSWWLGYVLIIRRLLGINSCRDDVLVN